MHSENSHAFVNIAPGEGGYEALQMACVIKKVRLVEPDIKSYNDSSKLKSELEKCALDVLTSIKDGFQTGTISLFLINREYLKDPEYLDIVN